MTTNTTANDTDVKELAKLFNSEISAIKKLLNSQLPLINSEIKKLRRELQDLDTQLNVSYSKGFYDGRKYIVSTAEDILMCQTGCQTREDLAKTGNIPEFWTATLVKCFRDPTGVIPLAKTDNEYHKECLKIKTGRKRNDNAHDL